MIADIGGRRMKQALSSLDEEIESLMLHILYKDIRLLMVVFFCTRKNSQYFLRPPPPIVWLSNKKFLLQPSRKCAA